MHYIWFGVGIILGLVIGVCAVAFYFKTKFPVGDLVVDRSDEDGPLLFLELHEPLSKVESQKEVTLQVVKKNYLPQN